MSMEDVKTDEKLADEVVNPEDAVSSEKEIEGTESCPEENTSEADQKEEDSAKSDSGKKGFFGKKKEKNDPKDDKIEELTDRLQRSMAEFDNFRKRTEKEKSAMFEIGAKDIIERILPEKIYKQLIKALEEAGVKPIEAVGMPFDPNFHNAVMHIEDESLGENVVAQELQKGYIYRDTVVRHSMVQVAN